MWQVSSRSGVATLRTAIHLLLTYLLLTHGVLDNKLRISQTRRIDKMIHPRRENANVLNCPAAVNRRRAFNYHGMTCIIIRLCCRLVLLKASRVYCL